MMINLLEKMVFRFLKLTAGEAFADSKFQAHQLLKAFFYQKMLGINSRVPWPVHRTSFFKAPEKIERGTRCPGLAPFCYIDGRNGIRIGSNTWIGPRVSLISMNHDMSDFTRYLKSDPIVIGDNCWIAAGAIITAGVCLGAHTVVAAGAVVTKSFPEGNVLIGGIPARIIRQLPDYENPPE